MPAEVRHHARGTRPRAPPHRARYRRHGLAGVASSASALFTRSMITSAKLRRVPVSTLLGAWLIVGTGYRAMAQHTGSQSDRPLILAGARIIEVDGKPSRTNVDIIIQGERITHIVQAG